MTSKKRVKRNHRIAGVNIKNSKVLLAFEKDKNHEHFCSRCLSIEKKRKAVRISVVESRRRYAQGGCVPGMCH